MHKSGNLAVVHPSQKRLDEVEGDMAVIAAECIPEGRLHTIVDVLDIPSDKTFRNAWHMDINNKFDVSLTKSRGIAHDLRRRDRSNEFAPFDDVIMKQIPGADSVAAEASRAAVRTKYETMQTGIDEAASTDELKVLLGIS